MPRFPNIAAERAKRGMSLNDLADAIGVSRKTLFNWRRAGHIPGDALTRMSQIFGVSVEYLKKTD